ncbi:transporter [Xanthomonas sp. NCPPB 3582]|uniref:SphA family protein n=1 Tax=Xanthomonas sp. NCPPB 3582 TaxID=487557 RepID=UPI0035574741
MSQQRCRPICSLSASLLICSAFAAQATENGAPSTPMGLYDFGGGFMPPSTPVGTFGARAAYYSTDRLNDGAGRRSPNDFSLDVLSLGLAYIRMTDAQFLGARYGFSTVVPFFRMDAALAVNVNGVTVFRDQAKVFRLADVQVTPVILQWTPSPNLGINFQFQVQAPTGDYDASRLISPGLNRWTYSPLLNVSWISQGGLELSSSFQFDINARNPDTDYRSGVEYRHEFAIGQHLGAWTAGLGGYYYRQITDDQRNGQDIGNRARVVALGPAVSFFEPGKMPLWLHVYREFGARNRAEGYNVALRFARTF